MIYVCFQLPNPCYSELWPAVSAISVMGLKYQICFNVIHSFSSPTFGRSHSNLEFFSWFCIILFPCNSQHTPPQHTHTHTLSSVLVLNRWLISCLLYFPLSFGRDFCFQNSCQKTFTAYCSKVDLYELANRMLYFCSTV